MKNTTTNTWRDARALDPWAYPTPKPEFDVARLDVNFETVDKAKAERGLRVQHLRRAGSIEHRRLADTLQSCAPRARCCSAACPICCRRLRRWFVGSVLETLGDIPDPIAVTLIPGDQAVPAARLEDISPGRLKDMLRQQLRRAGVGDQIVAGGIDGDYDEAYGLWQPHFHLIAPASARPLFKALRRRFYAKSDRVYRPMLPQQLKNPAKQISYCVKSFWPQMVRYFDNAGKKRRDPRRLDEPLHVEWLMWRSRIPMVDLVFLHGVRRYGCELRRTGSSDGRPRIASGPATPAASGDVATW